MDKPWDQAACSPRNILLFAVAPLWTPHFETELEIVAGHQRAGDTVDVATCDRELASCLANPYRHLYACLTCKSRAAHGLDAAGLPASNRHVLGIEPGFDLNAPRFASIDELRVFEVDGVDVGAAAASTLISILRESAPDLRLHTSLVQSLLRTAVGLFDAASKLLEELRPDLVYVFNGRYASTAPLIRACERADIPFTTHEAGYELNTYRLIPGSTVHDLETLKRAVVETWEDSALSVDERIRIGREFFVGRRSGGVGDAVDEYQFARRQERGRLPAEVDQWSGRKVVIFTSSEDEFAIVESFANPVYKDQVDALDAIVRHDWPDDIRIVLREHPNLSGVTNDQTKRLRALGALPHVTVIAADSTVDSYSVLDVADVVVTFGSTVGAEAVYWGFPSVLVGRAVYEDHGPIRPTSHAAVVDAILKPPGLPSSDDIVRYGFFERQWSIPFERYHQDTFRTGTFDGLQIRPARTTKLASVLLHLGVATIDVDERRVLTDRLNRRRSSRGRTQS